MRERNERKNDWNEQEDIHDNDEVIVELILWGFNNNGYNSNID